MIYSCFNEEERDKDCKASILYIFSAEKTLGFYQSLNLKALCGNKHNQDMKIPKIKKLS